jgi:hypothetical protein
LILRQKQLRERFVRRRRLIGACFLVLLSAPAAFSGQDVVRAMAVGLRKSVLFPPPIGWYDVFMSRDTEALLDAFEHLPVEEKRAFTQEVLRRSLPFESAPLEDEEIGAASSALFESLEEEDGHPAPR